MLANSIQNCLGLRYTKLLISCGRQTHGENALSRSTINLAFRRIQPKITKNQKIQQDRKELRKVERCKVSTSEAMVDHAQ